MHYLLTAMVDWSLILLGKLHQLLTGDCLQKQKILSISLCHSYGHIMPGGQRKPSDKEKQMPKTGYQCHANPKRICAEHQQHYVSEVNSK